MLLADFPIVTRIESCANINTAGTGQVTTPAEGDSNGGKLYISLSVWSLSNWYNKIIICDLKIE